MPSGNFNSNCSGAGLAVFALAKTGMSMDSRARARSLVIEVRFIAVRVALLLCSALYDYRNGRLAAGLRFQFCGKDYMPLIVFRDRGGCCPVRHGKAYDRRVIRAARLSAQLYQFFKFVNRIGVLIRAYGNHHEEIADRRDAEMIAVHRMNRVTQSVSPGFNRLTSKVVRRFRKADD